MKVEETVVTELDIANENENDGVEEEEDAADVVLKK